MSDITPTTAVLELAKLSRELDAAGFKIRDAEFDAVRKRHAFVVAKAKAFMCAEGSVQAREAQAILDTAELKVAADLAEANLRILKSDIRIIEGRMDAGRSVVGVLRAEASVVR